MVQSNGNDANDNSEELVSLTVRFTRGAYDAFSQIAEKHNMSKAEVIRLAIDNRLLNYLGNVEYVNPKDAEKMRKQIFRVGTELHNINLELNRIGVNFNQQVRLQNIKNKYKGKSDFLSIKRRTMEEDAVKKECSRLSPDDLSKLMKKEEECIDRFAELIKKSAFLKKHG